MTPDGSVLIGITVKFSCNTGYTMSVSLFIIIHYYRVSMYQSSLNGYTEITRPSELVMLKCNVSFHGSFCTWQKQLYHCFLLFFCFLSFQNKKCLCECFRVPQQVSVWKMEYGQIPCQHVTVRLLFIILIYLNNMI